MSDRKQHLLFICSMNQLRSPTAEALFKNNAFYEAKSAGTSESARIRVTEKMLQWADIVFVMEKRHRQLLQQRYHDLMTQKKTVVLDIPDDYAFMDPELVEMLQTALREFITW